MQQATYTRLKSRLTRAKNKFEKAKKAYLDKPLDRQTRAAAVRAAQDLHYETKGAYAVFEREGYPDQHHNWERAQNDAQAIINRLNS